MSSTLRQNEQTSNASIVGPNYFFSSSFTIKILFTFLVERIILKSYNLAHRSVLVHKQHIEFEFQSCNPQGSFIRKDNEEDQKRKSNVILFLQITNCSRRVWTEYCINLKSFSVFFYFANITQKNFAENKILKYIEGFQAECCHIT